MYWKKTHIVKVYEALTMVADNRIEVSSNGAVCYSNTGEFVCEVKYDPKIGSIMSNDKMAYFTHTISAPMIAFLICIEKLDVESSLVDLMSNIYWEDIYKKFKNDYEKSLRYVVGELKKNGDDVIEIQISVEKIYQQLCSENIKTFGELQRPGRLGARIRHESKRF